MTGIKFSLGLVVATSGITNNLDSLLIASLLERHASGDWGDMDHKDKELNDVALKSGQGRIFSLYNSCQGKIWIITEHDRSYTTVLFPNEY